MDSSRLVLASGSPRRLQLLAALGLDVEVLPVGVDETPLPGEAPADLACRLAADKAAAAAALQSPGRLVLAADTVVALDNQVLGKPADAAEARCMLQQLSGRRHLVHTAVAASRGGVTSVRLCSSEVDFRELRDAEIAAYAATGDPLDKAGGYGIQGLAGIFVTRLCGSYTGVMGLPVCETAELLRRHGVELLPAAAGHAP
jgi:septum formation protein